MGYFFPVGNLLAIITIVPLAIIVVILSISPRRYAVQNSLLGVILLVITILTIGTIILSDPLYKQYYPLAHLGNLFMILLGPLMFFYIRSFLEPKFRLKWQYLLVLVPFCLAFMSVLYQVQINGAFGNKYFNQPLYKIFESLFNLGFFIACPIVAIRAGIRIQNLISNFKDLRLIWLMFLYISLLIIWITKVYTSLQYEVFHRMILYVRGNSIYFNFVSIFYIILVGAVFIRDRIFYTKGKYQNTGLTPEEKVRYFDRIRATVLASYLDPELDLGKLSRLSKVPLKTVSQVINEHTGVHFNEYINRFRIDHACRLLSDTRNNKTVLSILYDSGFNSKSTFNSAFKKITGMTPVEFKTCIPKRYEFIYSDDSISSRD